MVVEKVKKSEKQLANEKSKRVMDGVAYWGSFYRANPQRFVKDYLNVDLRLFQKFLIYAMMHNNHFMFWAARSLGKTYLTALFCVVRCILFPGTKICVASATRSQANEVLQKITEDFMKLHDWGSDLLRREIESYTVGANKAEIIFRNGSWIKVVTASDTGRGARANVLLLDEFRMIDKNTITLVLKRFLGAPRQPNYLNLPEYKDREDLTETNIEMYLSSCWFKSHWSYDKSKAYTFNLLGGREGYFVCGLPYQMAIKERLKKRVEIEDEMSEKDFDQMLFDMEMGCMPFGSSDDAFFSFDDVTQRRRLQTAMYAPGISALRDVKIPEPVMNERRILSVDVALMASGKHKNDASSIIINSAIPTNNNEYTANIVYMENQEGLNADELALVIRRLYKWFKCTDLVIDGSGVGQGVLDLLMRDMLDPETGELYHALSCRNNKAIEERCRVANAPKEIWVIKADAGFNSIICNGLRSGFQRGKINLLVSEAEAEELLKDKYRNYKKMTPNDQLMLKMPYIQTTLLVYELISLEFEIKGTNVRVYEKSGKRKDRYSSLAYNYWVQCQLENEFLQNLKSGFNASDYAKKLKGLNRKPRSY